MMKEGEQSSYEHIRSQKTLKEILKVATAFEAAAHAFYNDLAPRVSKNLRWLVEKLAEEELCHYDLFVRLATHQDIEQQIQSLVEVPASDGHFSDLIHLSDLGEQPDDQQVLQYALGREHTAMVQYRALADSTAPGAIHDLFEFLSNEETQHKAELEKLYYEIVHTLPS